MKKMLQTAAFAAFLLAITNASAQTPDTFTWAGGASNSWDAAGAWTTTSPRTAPGIAGDTAQFSSSANVYLPGDKTLSKINATVAYNLFRYASPVTLTLSNGGDASITNLLTAAAGTSVQIGNNLAGGDSGFALALTPVSRLQLQNTTSAQSRMFVNAKITGGTTGAPGVLLIDFTGGDGYFRSNCMLTNPDNDFVGDIIVGHPNQTINAHLNLGYHSQTVNYPGNGSMLGHPTNTVYLKGASVTLRVRDAGLHHRVVGKGSLRGGSFSSQWGDYTSTNLRLDNGFVAEPCAFNANGTVNPSAFGTMTFATELINASHGITIDPKAKFVFTLGPGATDNDIVNFNQGKAFSFTGEVILEPQGFYSLGKFWDIMKISSTALTFTLAPSFVTPGFNLTVYRNTNNDWIVRATRVRDTSAVPDISTLLATRVGETYATFNFNALGVAPDGSATVRAYISETKDEGETTLGWSRVVEYPSAVNSAGALGFKVGGLALNQTYHIRHSISNSAGEFVSLDSASFTTRPWDTPDVFRLRANVTSGNWHDEAAWEHDTYYDRSIPGLIGDTAQIYVGAPPLSRTLNLTNDTTLSALAFYQGAESGEHVTLKADNGPVTLAFDAPAGQTGSITVNGLLRTVNLGASVAETNLTVHFNRPITFHTISHYAHTLNFYGKVTGGSDTHPSDMFVTGSGDEYRYMQIAFLNTNNTCRGDFHLGATTVVNPSARLIQGNGAVPLRDSMLGHPGNKIILRHNSFFNPHPPAGETAKMSRTVKGNGIITTEQFNANYGWSNGDGHRPLAFTGTAVLAPCGIAGSGFGTIAVRSSTFSDDPATQYKIKLADAANSNDKINFTVTGASSVTGKLVFEKAAGVQKIPTGLTWEVMTINKPAGAAFTHSLKGSSGFAVKVENVSATQIIVKVTSVPTSTLLLLR